MGKDLKNEKTYLETSGVLYFTLGKGKTKQSKMERKPNLCLNSNTKFITG